jgi:hypothetical protein
MRFLLGVAVGAIAAWAAMVFWNVDPVDLLNEMPEWIGDVLR